MIIKCLLSIPIKSSSRFNIYSINKYLQIISYTKSSINKLKNIINIIIFLIVIIIFSYKFFF
jgi:hypothetical protein